MPINLEPLRSVYRYGADGYFETMRSLLPHGVIWGINTAPERNIIVNGIPSGEAFGIPGQTMQIYPDGIFSGEMIGGSIWGSKYPLADPRIEFADYVIIGGVEEAIRLKATATFLKQFPGVSIKPPWGSVPFYIWKFQSIPSTQYPPPNSRFGFTDNASYDGNVYDFHHGETGNRVFLQILSDITGTNAYVKLIAVRNGTNDQGSGFEIIKYDEYATYPISDFKTKSFKLEISGPNVRMLYNGSPVVTPQTDSSGWVNYTTTMEGDFRPVAALSSQTFWVQLDDNYDILTSELIVSDSPFIAGTQAYTPVPATYLSKLSFTMHQTGISSGEAFGQGVVS